MARSFLAASSQAIEVASAPSINFGSGDYTVLAWVRFPTIPDNGSMIVGKRAGGFDADEGWELKFDNAANGDIRWDHQTNITGRQRAEVDIPTLVNGSWHLLGGDHSDTASQLRIWFDGAIVATKAASTPGSVDTTTPLVIGAAFNTPNSNFLTGEIGPVFTLKRVLTLAEHQFLAKGFSPRFLRPLPEFLIELISRASPEPDIVGGLTGTLQNAPAVVDNPRLVLPRSPTSGPDTWFEFGNATVAGQSTIVATGTGGRGVIGTAAGQSTLTVVQTRGRTASATSVGQSAIVASLSEIVPLVATIPGQSNLVVDIGPIAVASAAVNAQSSVLANVAIGATVGAESRAQSGLSASISATVPITAMPTGQSSLTAVASASVRVDAQADGQSALLVSADRGRTLSTTLSGQSTAAADVKVNAGVTATTEGNLTVAGVLSATVPIAVTVDALSDVTASIAAGVPVAATSAGASALSGTLTRARAGEATIQGQSDLIVETRALVPSVATVSASSFISAATIVEAGAAATVGARSGVSALPTYPGVRKTVTTGGVARFLKTVGGWIRS